MSANKIIALIAMAASLSRLIITPTEPLIFGCFIAASLLYAYERHMEVKRESKEQSQIVDSNKVTDSVLFRLNSIEKFQREITSKVDALNLNAGIKRLGQK